MTIKRYQFLDGMRGIAAVFVLIRHTSGFWNFNLFHSYLAVDLFFLLSGFVIGTSYDQRLTKGILSNKQFLTVRLIRLYPMFFISLLFCVSLELAINYYEKKSILSLDFARTVLLTSIFIPSRTAGSIALFSINYPYWSLFYELVTNVMYSLFRKKLSDRWLLSWVIFFGFFMASVCIIHGDLNIGVSWEIDSIIAGFSRAMFGFGLGVLFFRKIEIIKKHLPTKLPWLAIALVALTLAMPSFGKINALVDLVSLFFIFPVCVIMCLQGEPKKFEKILLIFGVASYPIYVLHIPAGRFLSLISRGHAEQFAPLTGLIFVILLFVGSIWLEKNLDIPIRRRLTQFFLNKRS